MSPYNLCINNETKPVHSCKQRADCNGSPPRGQPCFMRQRSQGGTKLFPMHGDFIPIHVTVSLTDFDTCVRQRCCHVIARDFAVRQFFLLPLGSWDSCSCWNRQMFPLFSHGVFCLRCVCVTERQQCVCVCVCIGGENRVFCCVLCRLLKDKVSFYGCYCSIIVGPHINTHC